MKTLEELKDEVNKYIRGNQIVRVDKECIGTAYHYSLFLYLDKDSGFNFMNCDVVENYNKDLEYKDKNHLNFSEIINKTIEKIEFIPENKTWKFFIDKERFACITLIIYNLFSSLDFAKNAHIMKCKFVK